MPAALSLLMNIDEINKNVQILIEETYRDSSKWHQNFELAKKLLKKALDENPNHESSLINYGTVLCDFGSHKAAIEYLMKAIDLGSQNKHAFFNLGVALLNSSSHKDAKAYFKKASSKTAGFLTWEAYFDPMAH